MTHRHFPLYDCVSLGLVENAGVSQPYTTTSDSDVYPPSRRRRWRRGGIAERGCTLNHCDANEIRRDASRRVASRPDPTRRDERYAFAMRVAM